LFDYNTGKGREQVAALQLLHRTIKNVILSERSESKNLRTDNAAQQAFGAKILRLHFVSLRMTGAGYSAASSMFSMKMPYPVSGLLTSTWLTAPTSLSSCMIGEPLTSDCHYGQQNPSIFENARVLT